MWLATGTLARGPAGAATINSDIDLDGGTRTVTIADTAAGSDALFSGGLSNGGLTKMGASTLQLLGNSTYTGATSINQGELFVSGSLTSAVTVANGAILCGTNDGIRGSERVTGRGSPALPSALAFR